MTPLREWFVAFLPARTCWWHRFLKPGFQHITAFGYDPDAKTWLLFEPAFEGFLVRAIDPGLVPSLVTWFQDAGAVILKARFEGYGARRPRLFATCVTVIVHLLGLRAWVLTPHGLYKVLLRHGAVEAFKAPSRSLCVEADGGADDLADARAREAANGRTDVRPPECPASVQVRAVWPPLSD